MADKYNTADRKRMASSGAAMSDGSYPIADEEDLHDAIRAVGRGGGSHDAIRAHIIKRAKALGLSSAIPDNWSAGGSMSGGSDGGRDAGSTYLELRYTPSTVELRSTPEGDRIGGYGAVFGKLSKNLGGFVELVDTGAFNRSRADGWPNVICRYNHSSDFILGTTRSGRLQLRTDHIGLDYEVYPPQSRTDILDLVKSGDIEHSSFAFRCAPGGDEWRTSDQNYPMRVLHDVELVDVAPVVDPAYPDATAGLRSLADAMGAPLEEVRSMAAADELRRFFARTDRPSVQPPRPRTTGPQAMMRLMEKRFPPRVK